MNLLKCFIVEDSPMIRDNLVATLEEMLPLRVIGTAEDEHGAVTWLRTAPADECDIVIIDIFLKAGSGLGVLRAAHAQVGRRAKLVVLSNYATPDMRKRCQELGADRFFDKSHEVEKLIDYCGALCERPASA